MNDYMVECCANSIESAIEGEKGGANRIELCKKLEVGGTTPSRSDIIKTKKQLKIPLHVLIRPKFNNFIYTEKQLQKMITDIIFCKANKCEGVVIGALTENGSINITQTKKMVEAAKPMHITFHRAFDEGNNLITNLEDVIASGCDTLLTSGQASNVNIGCENLKTLLKTASGRINILAGSGVSHENVEELFKIGIRKFHLSGSEKNKNGILKTNSKKIKLLVTKLNNIV